MKKHLIRSLIALSLLPFVASCSSGKKENDDKEEPYFAITQETATVAKYDSCQLTYVMRNFESPVSWSVSNASIASVDDTGYVTGVSEGSCVVTATAGDYTSNCSLTVTAASASAVLVLGDSEITLLAGGDSYATDLYATYKGEIVEDAEFSFSFENGSNGNIVSVSYASRKMTVAPVRAGTAVFTVYGEVRDTLLTAEVTVTVVA